MRHLITLTLILVSTSTFGQDKFDINSFILGVIGDRQIIKEEQNDKSKIDVFFYTEVEIMDFIDSLVTIENKKRNLKYQIKTFRKVTVESNCDKCDKSYIYSSELLSKYINKNSRLKFSNNWDLKQRKIYVTETKSSSLKTDNDRIAFLLGVFLRFGKVNNDRYTLNIYKTKAKFEIIEQTLKGLQCEIITKDTEILTDDTGKSSIGTQTIEFYPSRDLRLELLKLTTLKSRLVNNKEVYLQRVQ